MRHIFIISIFIFTLILGKDLSAQVIWEENFDVPDKGVWANENGEIITDFTTINWSVDYSGCTFSNESDYAKTVSTSGGRFEVLDSDGEVIWTSDSIDISSYDAVNLSLDANETGSSEAGDKKYLKAYYKLDGSDEMPFEPEFEALGNWGVTQLSQKKLVGQTLQIVVRMNSSYANDKVILDNITVQAIDSSTFVPSQISITASPLFAFSEDTTIISAATTNKDNELIADSTLLLSFISADLNVTDSWYENGTYSWAIVTTKNGELNYSIADDSNELSAVDSTILYFSRTDAKLIEKFEGNSPQGWQLGSDWEVSTVEPISGSQSIKHALENVTGTSVLSYNDNQFNLPEEDYLFSFKLKNGNWDPSGSNLFYLWLKSTTESNAEGGYMIGVNAEGSNDLLTLWKVINGEPVDIIAETQFDWNENISAEINVMRSASGKWIISATDLNTGASYAAKGTDDQFQKVDEVDLVFSYTSTRAGQLWFDDMIIIGQNAAPFIKDAKAIAADQFQVFFNEAIQMDKLDASNLKLASKSGQDYPIQSIEKVDESSVIIHTSIVTDAFLIVTAKSITDLDGKTTSQSGFEFENELPAATYDIIFNEIMADPTPVVELPEAEYIEIYNRSNHYIELEKWVLFVRNTDFVLPQQLIAPGEYLIICDDEFAELFKAYGTVLSMNNFPALLNSGATLKLNNTDGEVIDSIDYTHEWYHNSEKDNGGYSLERIDKNRMCGQRDNWQASNDPKGGTPGQANAVEGDNVDVTPPQFMAIDILSYTQLKLYFNEPLDAAVAFSKNNYSITGISIGDVLYSPGELTATLDLNEAIQFNKEYELTVHQLIDECGNVGAESTLPFTMVALASGQVLINEVLFNPYTNGADFVELYNNSGLTLDLADLKLATRDDSLNLKSVYKVSDLHAPFGPGEFLVFTKDTLNILENYRVPYPERLKQMSNFPAYNNTEGRVVVLNDSLLVIDELAYTESMHSKWLTSYDGVSLERLSTNLETNDAANWQSASSLVGYATPGYENSQTEIAPEQQLNVELESDEVSPNGDGYNDELILKFSLDQPGYLANVYIFNSAGKEVRRLTNNDLIGNNLEVTYDLRNKDGSLLPMGIYLVYTELVHLDVKKKTFKNAFIVTDKL